MTDLQGDITFVNRGFCQTTGYEEQEVLGKNPRILKSGDMPASVYKEMWETLSQGRQWRGELQNRRKNGDVFWELAVISPVTDEEEQITHYVAVKEDITERKRAEEQLKAYAAAMEASNRALEQSNRCAEAANRTKSEFLANMSHEIRTPMTAILGYADILADFGRPARATRGRPNDQTQWQSPLGPHQRHPRSVEDRGRQAPGGTLAHVSPGHPRRRGLADAGAGRGQGIPLKLEYFGPIPQTIQIDPTRLRQILVNLVGNAIKFTETGEVKIAVRLVDRDTAEPKLQCEVIDTGVGISPEHLGRLFQPFQQADASTTRKFGGTGLGLAISKRLAKLLGGDITARSVLGKGSSFTLTIATGPLEGTPMLDQPAEAVLPVPAKPKLAAAAQVRLDLPDSPGRGWTGQPAAHCLRLAQGGGRGRGRRKRPEGDGEGVGHPPGLGPSP